MRTTNGRGGSHARPGWKIPNGKFADETRQLKDWIPLCEETDGVENRDLVMSDIFRIWKNAQVEEVVIRGKMKLGGELYGCHGHHNGDQVITPNIVSIKRLTHGKPCINRFARDILCATADTGEVYFFNSDQFNICTAIIFWDIDNEQSLNTDKHFYVHPDYQKEEFM